MNRRGFIRAVSGLAAVFAAGIDLTVPRKRKLKAIWSSEAAMDLRAVHNLQAENELSKLLAMEINREIDKEILTTCRENNG